MTLPGSDIQISDSAGTICTMTYDEARKIRAWLDLEASAGELSEGLAVLRESLRELLDDLLVDG